MTTIHFLAAADGTPLTKRFRLTEEGLTKDPYPQVATFSSDAVEVKNIEDFLVALAAHAQNGHCLLKGQLDTPLKNQSRAGHTNSDTPTDWLVLDNDNLHNLAPQQLMDQLGLGDVDHIVQYSASAGIEPGKRGYHIFVLLDRPWSPADLKLRLRAWNLDVAQIRDHFQLSRTNNSLRWPLDITVCQNDKLIYIAPPTLGQGVSCTLEGDRIHLVTGTKRVATFAQTTETDDLLTQRENSVLNQLRKQGGLPAKNLETRTVKDVVVARNPDQAQITGRKEERGFVYLNLNGGDSWGFYHPVTSPDVLFNFKSEPNYLIQDLLPDYYPQALVRAKEASEAQALDRRREDMEEQTQRIRTAEANGGRVLQAFRDKKTDQYFVGWIDPQDQSHDLDPIGTKGRIQELFAQHGYPKVEVIPTVDFRFEPANDALYDLEAGFVNRYMPPAYRKNAQARDDAEIPPTIRRVIECALGDDPEVVEHFLNWLAVLFRYRICTQTAWIFQGTTGTGKGLLFSQILRPLIGDAYCMEANLTNLEEQFNGFAEQIILLFVDEVDTDQVRQMAKLMAHIKSMITESVLPLRAMRQDLRQVPNHLYLILSSNQPNSMRIEANDRRFNVCPRQEQKLLALGESGEELVTQIQAELQDFADYLMSRVADRAKARQALDNEPKRLLQTVTQTAIEEVATAFRDGDLAYFMDQRPAAGDDCPNYYRSPFFNGRDVRTHEGYREFLADALDAVVAVRKHVVLHDALFAVFELLVGDMPTTKTKLTKRLGHQNLSIEPHNRGSTSTRGLGVQWKAKPEQVTEWRALLEEDAKKSATPEISRPSRQRETADGTGQ